MISELKLIQFIYNTFINLIACLMKIVVIFSLPFAYIYYMWRAVKSKNNHQNLIKIKKSDNSLLHLNMKHH